MLDLSRYESAWAILASSNTSTLSDATRICLVAVALNLNYGDNKHQAGVIELFSPRWSPAEILKCLDEILRIEIRQSRGSLTPGLACSPTFPPKSSVETNAIAEANARIASMLADIERRHCGEPTEA